MQVIKVLSKHSQVNQNSLELLWKMNFQGNLYRKTYQLKITATRVNTFFPCELSWKPKTQPNGSSGFQLGLWQTQALINTYCMTIIKHHHLSKPACRRLTPLEAWTVHASRGESSSSRLLEMMMFDDGHATCINQCLCLPKAELKIGNSAVVSLSFWCSTRFTRTNVIRLT